MAKINNSISFKNSEISLEENQIVEFLKEEILEHTLSDVIKRFKGKKMDITFKEVVDLLPSALDEN